jgi:hypothetical protein
MGFGKGENGKKRKVVDITPSKTRSQTDVPLAIMETILKGYRGSSNFDYEKIEYMVKEIKLLKLDNDTIDAVASLLNDHAVVRKEMALELKDALQEIASETTINQYQDQLIRSISKMNADDLDNFEKFLELGRAKVDFCRHTSKFINPIYKLHEIIAEALKELDNVDAEGMFGYEDSHRTVITRSNSGSNSGNGSSSSGNGHSSSSSGMAPLTMEGITQKGIDGR